MTLPSVVRSGGLLCALCHRHEHLADEIVHLLRCDSQGAGLGGQEPNEAGDRRQDFAACRPGDPCSVCHSCFEAGETVTQLDCGHCFHGDCILPWLEAHNTCPVCRSQLPRELPGAHHHHGTDSAATDNAPVAQVRNPDPCPSCKSSLDNNMGVLHVMRPTGL